MKPFFRILSFFILLFFLQVMSFKFVFADTSLKNTMYLQAPTPSSDGLASDGDSETEDLFTFEDFRFEETTMLGPFSTAGYFFDLPATWKHVPGAELYLVLDTYYTGATANALSEGAPTYGGILIVQYNYVTLATIDLNQEGQMLVRIPISLDILDSLSQNQGQSLQFILDSGVNCEAEFRTIVVIRDNSQLYFPHQQIPPPLDLTLLPVPFFQNSFKRDSIIIAVPNHPSSVELQAAMAVSSGFGRMTSNRSSVFTFPADQIPADVLANSHIIFVGKPVGLPILQEIPLKLDIVDGLFDLEPSLEANGVIMMALSPWNESKVVMIVGGNNDQAVLAAGRAVSTGKLRVGTDPSITYVSSATISDSVVNPSPINQTFKDLGYDSVVVSGAGQSIINYLFEVPQGYSLTPDVYLDLFFSHSAHLEYGRSNILIRLNGEPVGSVQLTDNSGIQGPKRIGLPVSAFRPGANRLQLEIDMQPKDECISPFLNGLWMRIDSSSVLHLSVVPDTSSVKPILDLRYYPAPFAFDPELQDLAFVLAEDDPTAWDVASQIAFHFGYVNTVSLAGFETHYSNAVPENVRNEKNLIIIGRPGDLKIFEDLSDSLPMPFDLDTNLAVEENLQVSYSLETGVDVGYLELFPNPWNEDHSILYIGGSSDVGIEWAAEALKLGRLRSQLTGNIAFVSGEQVVAVDTRITQSAGDALSTALPAEVSPQTTPPQSVLDERPAWVLTGIYIALGGIVIILIILGIQAILKMRSGKEQ